MRFTRRELVLTGALAVVVAVVLGYTLFHGTGSRPSPGAQAVVPNPTTPAASKSPPASGKPSALKTEYAVRGKWPGGFNAELVLTNIGSQPVEGWTVRLRLPPDVKIGSVWSATVTQVPDAVILRSQPWNTYVAPGATVHLGFEATGTASAPSSCTVNGAPC
jgi:cellulase/cellobiase CelA1